MVAGSNTRVSLQDNSITFRDLQEVRVAVSVEPDIISWAVFHPQVKQIVAIESRAVISTKSKEEQIGDLLNDIPLEVSQIGRVDCGIVPDKLIFVPSVVFDGDKSAEIVESSYSPSEKGYHHKQFSSSNMVAVFESIQSIETQVLKKWKNVDFHLSPQLMLEAMLEKYRFGKSPHFSIFVGINSLEIYVIKEREFLFHNRFVAKNAEDVLFYLLQLSERLGLNQNEIEIHLAGEAFHGSALSSMSREYFKNVDFNLGYQHVAVSKELSSIRKQSFIPLFHLLTCA